MIDYMLKFQDQAEAESVLLQNGLIRVMEEQLIPVMGHAVDIIGPIYKPDGTFTEADGIRFPNQVAVEGYHVNVRTSGAIEALEAYNTTPATPYRVWA